MAAMGGSEEFTRRIQNRLSLVLSDQEVISLAQEYGWQDEWMAVTARKAKAKAPPSHNITESMAKAAGVTVQQPLVLPPVPPVQW